MHFLPVGNRYKSGDAIAVRWGQPGASQVLVYDGGSTESGKALVTFVRERLRSSRVDYAVSSHPDGDHASGLLALLQRLEVGELWMHRPWQHASAARDAVLARHAAATPLERRLRSKLRAARKLEMAALQRGIPIHEPFQGADIGSFRVLSPSRDWYLGQLLPAFGLPLPPLLPAPAAPSPPEPAQPGADRESWGTELLRETVRTSADNEASVVLWGQFGDQGVLLTGDAGIQALGHAADRAQAEGIDLPARLGLLQVPHHGSRHNVSPSVLDRLLGPRKPQDDGQATKRAFVSAGAGSTQHPHAMVTNALLRRGATPYATQGQVLSHSPRTPSPGGPGPEPLPFREQVAPWAPAP
ncbi:MAG TPA: MBL fold metallo-hydrolase [Burkholderiaceae bacterium]|nr:MBL fold metallo-hydrolase [Burkholderiaceae bacterium]